MSFGVLASGDVLEVGVVEPILLADLDVPDVIRAPFRQVRHRGDVDLGPDGTRGLCSLGGGDAGGGRGGRGVHGVVLGVLALGLRRLGAASAEA